MNAPNKIDLARVAIRQLRRSDLPALEWEGEFSHFRRLYREIFESSLNGKAVLWVAETAGIGVIGQVFVQLISGRQELADGMSRAYVYGFRIRAPYRNLGIGALLLQRLEKDLLRRDFKQVTLNVARDNPDAQRFYERHGYTVVGAEPGIWSYLDDDGLRHEVNEPAWRMRKSLVPGGA